MAYIPSNEEIHVYVNDVGVVSCYEGCDDWVPAYDLHARRITLDELIDTIRQHVAMEHAHDPKPGAPSDG